MKKRNFHYIFRFSLLHFFCLVPLYLMLPASLLRAQLLTLPVNLTYLAQRADIIVQGRIADVRYENHPDFDKIPTVKVTLEVQEMLRGPSLQTCTFREVLIGLKARKGQKAYKVGQRLMLFLPSPSKYGLSSPVGIEQGRFHITRTAEGEDTIANEIGNAGLFKDVENTVFMSGIRLSTKHRRLIEIQNGPVPLEEFTELVKSLTALPRIH
jgi:hypothetical protein